MLLLHGFVAKQSCLVLWLSKPALLSNHYATGVSHIYSYLQSPSRINYFCQTLSPLNFFFFLLTCIWLHWVFVAVHGLSLAAASRMTLSSRDVLRIAVASLVADKGLSNTWALAVVVHGLSCPVTFDIFSDQGWNPCPLHWQTGS